MRVKLQEIVDAFGFQVDDHETHLDLKTGRIVVIPDAFSDPEVVEMADLSYEGPDTWYEEAREIHEDDGTRYVALPSKHEIRDWSLMLRLVRDQEDPEVRARLLGAIHGRGLSGDSTMRFTGWA